MHYVRLDENTHRALHRRAVGRPLDCHSDMACTRTTHSQRLSPVGGDPPALQADVHLPVFPPISSRCSPYPPQRGTEDSGGSQPTQTFVAAPSPTPTRRRRRDRPSTGFLRGEPQPVECDSHVATNTLGFFVSCAGTRLPSRHANRWLFTSSPAIQAAEGVSCVHHHRIGMIIRRLWGGKFANYPPTCALRATGRSVMVLFETAW